jgi:hypothetical protein
MITGSKVLRLNKYEKDGIARRVANFWLKASERHIAAGLNPAKLSVQVRDLIIGEIDDYPVDTQPTSREITMMSKQAIAEAMFLLRNGRFPTVRAHFSQPRQP